jgi:hypothetical protein
MAINGGVSFTQSKPRGVARLVEVEGKSFDALQERLSDRIRYMDVVKILDIKPYVVRNLIEDGLLTKNAQTILDGRVAYFEGRIRSFRFQTIESFRDVHVDFNDLKNVIQQEILRGEGGYVTMGQAAEKYSIVVSTLECLLRNNAIQCKKKIFGGRQYVLIREADIISFLKSYIMASDVAKHYRKHRSKITSLLASKGVLPLWRPKPGDS